MILKTRMLGQTYEFKDVKDVLAKASEKKSGDELAGVGAESALERDCRQGGAGTADRGRFNRASRGALRGGCGDADHSG